METKALPCWTTGVEPLVERPCLPTPWRTTLPYLLILLSLLPSSLSPPFFPPFPYYAAFMEPRFRFQTFVPSFWRGSSDYGRALLLSSADRCGFIDETGTGLAATMTDHGPSCSLWQILFFFIFSFSFDSSDFASRPLKARLVAKFRFVVSDENMERQRFRGETCSTNSPDKGRKGTDDITGHDSTGLLRAPFFHGGRTKRRLSERSRSFILGVD